MLLIYVLHLTIPAILAAGILYPYVGMAYRSIYFWSTLLGWYVALMTVGLLPLDIEQAHYKRCLDSALDADICRSLMPSHYPSFQLIRMPLLISYWFIFLASWVYYPALMSFSVSRQLTFFDRAKDAVRRNIMFYSLFFLAGTVPTIIAAVVIPSFTPKDAITAFMSIADGWGTMLLVSLLGTALVKLPKECFLRISPRLRPYRYYFRVGKYLSAYEVELKSLRKVIRTILFADAHIPAFGDDRTVINELLAKIPAEHRSAAAQALAAESNKNIPSISKMIALHELLELHLFDANASNALANRSKREAIEAKLAYDNYVNCGFFNDESSHMVPEARKPARSRMATTVLPEGYLEIRTRCLDAIMKHRDRAAPAIQSSTAVAILDDIQGPIRNLMWKVKAIYYRFLIPAGWALAFVASSTLSLLLVVINVSLFFSMAIFKDHSASILEMLILRVEPVFPKGWLDFILYLMIAYTATCVYFLLTRIKLFNIYQMRPRFTNWQSAIFTVSYAARISFSIILNDIYLIGFQNTETATISVAGTLKSFFLFGANMVIVFPILMIVFALFTIFNIWDYLFSFSERYGVLKGFRGEQNVEDYATIQGQQIVEDLIARYRSGAVMEINHIRP